MKSRFILVAAGVALIFVFAAMAFGQEVDKTELATKIADARQKNQMETRNFSWTQRTEVKVDGEVKTLKTELVRFTADGELQKTVVSEEGGGGKKRGIRGQVAKKKTGAMKEWAQSLTQLLQQYSLPTAGSLLDFLNKAEAHPVEQATLFQLSAKDVVQSGDSMDMWVDPNTKELKKSAINTALDGDAVQVETQHGKTPEGLSYTARQIVRVPAKKVEMTVENFNYQRQ